VCEPCRLEHQRIGHSLDAEREPVPARHEDEISTAVLAGILDRIEQWNGHRSEPGRGEALKRRVESAVAPYLGAAAANQVLRSASRDGENLLPIIEPLLALFLGRRAASVLVSHIINDALVRTC